MKNKLGIYFHIPFCVRKCHYCDFCSYEKSDDPLRTHYIQTMKREILSYKGKLDNYIVDTIFFGGGTPTLLSVFQMKMLLDTLKEVVELDEEIEITSEANPKTADFEKLVLMREIGINRISVGVQSFEDTELQFLGRIHSSSEAKEFLKLVKDAGFTNFSLDLMYAFPGHTKESFGKTLQTALSFDPPHISCYALILEEGTKLYEMQNEYVFPSEDDDVALYEYAVNTLKEHGYTHYEISNYAKPGYECKHNKKYWEMKEYIGFGVAAYSYFDNKRFGYPRDIGAYLKEYFQTKRNVEIMDEKRYKEDAIMLGLRTNKGISKDLISKGKESFIKNCIQSKLLLENETNYIPTDVGMYVSSSLILDLEDDI